MSAHTSRNPLYLLAQVASEAKPVSLSSESLDNRLHIPCPVSSPSRSLRPPLAGSNSSNSMQPNFVPYVVRPKRKTRKSELDFKTRLQRKVRRKELMDKANKIKSLENSPVNDRQLSVLRMIYDEITMYPCESWMVLVAILIHRAYKQVKNWFSNERQKNRYGDSIPTETEEGDKVRLRASAQTMRAEWSDAFFEEVVMIYNFKVQRNSQSNHSIRRSSRTSDQ